MRPTEGQLHTEALRRAHDDVRPHLSGGLQDGEGEEIGNHNRLGAPFMCCGDERLRVTHLPASGWVLHHDARDVARGQTFPPQVAHLDRDPQRTSPRLQNGDGLWEEVGVHHQLLRCPRSPHRNGHGLGDRRRLVQERGVGGGQTREVFDHRLEVEQRLEPPLTDLGLIGRISGVPAWVLEDAALDHRRSERVVVAQSDHLHHGSVFGGDLTQLVDDLDLGQGRWERQPLTHPDDLRNRFVDDRIHARSSESSNHVLGLRLAGTDMSTHKGHVGLEIGEGCRRGILASQQVGIRQGVGHGSASRMSGLGSPSVICT